jgi:hypothetical protein
MTEYWMFALHQCELCDNPTEHQDCAECGENVCVDCHETYGCPDA